MTKHLQDQYSIVARHVGKWAMDDAEHMDIFRHAYFLTRNQVALSTEHTWDAEELLSALEESEAPWTAEECRQIIEKFSSSIGVNNWRKHQFTASEIRAIRAAREQDEPEPLKLLAHRYNASMALISKIARRKIYTNIV